MRPIKYRAFHKELKVMREVLELNIAHDEVTVYLENDDPEVCESETWFEGTFELMQFTGLYDYKETPIYESDILQIGKFLFEVVYHNDSFKLSELGSNGKYYFNLIEMIGHAIVCGSIHENPELLESNK